MSESATDAEPASLQGFITTLAAGAVVAGIYIAIFLVLRSSQKRYYVPRTYLGTLKEHERSPELPTGLFTWLTCFWKTPDATALRHQSLDAYLFLRFLRVCTIICFTGMLITWPVLFPINATGGGGQKQLDILSMSNINTSENAGRWKYVAHALIAWIFYGFVMFMILRECIYYINLRQAYLLSPQNTSRISARTVLFTNVPKKYMDVEKIRSLFGDSAKNIWITRETKDLDKIVEKRDKAAFQLEKAEIKLLKLATKARSKGSKGSDNDSEKDANAAVSSARWVPENKRPSHRTGLLGLVGPKVDTINHSREELTKLIPEAEAAQKAYLEGKTDPVAGVFVEFHTMAGAQAAAQGLTHHHALRMSPKVAGIRPDDVIWSNMNMPWWQKIVRRYIASGFLTAMIIFWAVPVAVVASFSQVPFLIERFSFLEFLNDVPSVVMGFITGLLPAVAMSILMSLVPVIIRLMARLSGEPSWSRVELFTQNVYFAFQVVQVFLVTTISGSAFSLVGDLAENPSSILSTVSTALPRSSNFYINYFLVQGLAIASTTIAQATGFVVFMLMYKFLANTPRAMYQKWTTLSSMSYGNTLPIYTNIAVISISYSVIAPLMLVWSSLGIFLFYLAYRYNILYVQTTTVDTNGLIYPRALKHLFVGIYLAEICLIGMCSVSRAYMALVLVVILLVFSVLFHITMMSALAPLLNDLPRSLEAKEEQRIAEGENAEVPTTKEKGSMLMRFFKPWKFTDYAYFRNLIAPHLFPEPHYEELTETNSFYPPTVTSTAPLLWIPEDAAGLSKVEIQDSRDVIPMTDVGATIDDKGKIIWDANGAPPPIYEEKVYY